MPAGGQTAQGPVCVRERGRGCSSWPHFVRHGTFSSLKHRAQRHGRQGTGRSTANETSKHQGPGLTILRSCSLQGRAVQQGPPTTGLSPGRRRPQNLARRRMQSPAAARAQGGRAGPRCWELQVRGKKAPAQAHPQASAYCPSSKGIKDAGQNVRIPRLLERAGRGAQHRCAGAHTGPAGRSLSLLGTESAETWGMGQKLRWIKAR